MDNARKTYLLTAALVLAGCTSASADEADLFAARYAGTDACCEPIPSETILGYECGCCDPVWTITADAVALWRDGAAGNALFQNVFAPAQNLAPEDLDFDYRAGFDLSVIRHIGCGPDWEIRYLDLDAWSARATATTNVANPLQINTTPPLFLVTGRTINASYSSDLENFEFNVRRPAGWLTWMVGFRYVELDESFRADLVDAITPQPTQTYSVATQNQMYGAQLGLESTLWEDCWLRIAGTAKGGILHNSGQQASVLRTGLLPLNAAGAQDRTSLLVEANLTAEYWLSNNLWIHGGYNIFVAGNVFLAPEQLTSTSFVSGTGSDGSGELFYHGASLGLVYRR